MDAGGRQPLKKDGKRDLVQMSWGFVFKPADGKAWRRVTNVRDDKILKSSFWKPSFEARRCLVPASSYCEPNAEKPAKWFWFALNGKAWIDSRFRGSSSAEGTDVVRKCVRQSPHALFCFIGIVVATIAPPPEALGQDLRFANRAFEITYTERVATPDNVVSNSAKPIPAFFDKSHRLALTFRRQQGVDYQREVNFGTIYQRDPKPDEKGGRIIEEEGSGTLEEWFPVKDELFSNAQGRVRTRGNVIYVEFHVSNFNELVRITSDGKPCVADIGYWPDKGETHFTLRSLKSGKLRAHPNIEAVDVRCGIGTGNVF